MNVSWPKHGVCTSLSCFRSFLMSHLGVTGWGSEMLNECRQAQESLNKLGASHHNLALCLGGTSDSASLREQLLDTRKTVHQLSTGTGAKLMRLLSSTRSLSPEDRAELERVWLLFASCMELFRRDLCQVHRLSLLFPLDLPDKFLTNTGVTCDPCEPSSDQSVKLESGEKVDGSELSLDLQIAEVGWMLCEVEMKVQAPAWSSEAIEEPWAEVNSVDSCGTASPEMLIEEEAEEGRGCNSGGCCSLS